MKILFHMVMIILMSLPALAMPPISMTNMTLTTKNGQSRTIYTGNHVIDISQYVGENTGDISEIVGMRVATDRAALEARMTYRVDPQQGGVEPEPLYVLRKNPQGKWTYAKHDSAGRGNFTYSDSLVGWNQPFPSMANVMLPIGEAGIDRTAAIENAAIYPSPQPIAGPFYPEFVFFTASDGDSTLMFQGQPMSGQIFQSLMYADTFPYPSTPGGRLVTHTVAQYIDSASHGHVQMLPGNARGGAYDLDGVINPAPNNLIRAYRVNQTKAELFSMNFTETGNLARDHMLELGLDPSRMEGGPLVVIWLYDWATEGWHGSGLWPHFSGMEGRIVSGAYYLDEVSMIGVIEHEFGHWFRFPDTYNDAGDNNRWDVQNRGSYNDGGWNAPYYPDPFAARHGWRGLATLSNGEQIGASIFIPLYQAIKFVNPRSQSGLEECKYFSCVNGSGLVSRQYNLITWQTYPDTPICEPGGT